MAQKYSFSKYLEKYKSRSLILRNFITIIVVVIVPFMLLFFRYYTVNYTTNKNMRQQIYEINKSYLANASNALENMYSEMKLLTYTVSQQTDIINFMFERDDKDLESRADSIKEILQSYTLIFKYIDSIYVYSENNRYILSNYYNEHSDFFPDKNWLANYGSAERNELVVIPRKCNNSYPYYLSFIVPVYDNSVSKIGSVVINVDIEQLSTTVLGYTKADNELYVLDKYKKLMFCDKYQMLYDNFGRYDFIYDKIESIESGKKDSLLCTITSPVTDWEYISIIPLHSNSYKKKSFVWQIVFTSLFLIIIILAAPLFLAIKTFKPIDSIIDLIDNTNQYNTKNIDNEARYIMNTIIHYIEDRNNIELTLNNRIQLLNHAYAVALQSQINPHFLYNTLETINFMAYDMCNGKNDISTITITLSKMLRFGLDLEHKIVPFTEELEHLQLYINILKIRYPNKCNFILDFSEDTKNCNIIKLCLQPIIENAFYHGIKPKIGVGNIFLKSFLQNKYFIIKISDDGVGMPPDKLSKLQHMLKNSTFVFFNHIGLNNVNSRIKMYFGDEYGITVSSNESEGTNIILTFPAGL